MVVHLLLLKLSMSGAMQEHHCTVYQSYLTLSLSFSRRIDIIKATFQCVSYLPTSSTYKVSLCSPPREGEPSEIFSALLTFGRTPDSTRDRHRALWCVSCSAAPARTGIARALTAGHLSYIFNLPPPPAPAYQTHRKNEPRLRSFGKWIFFFSSFTTHLLGGYASVALG